MLPWAAGYTTQCHTSQCTVGLELDTTSLLLGTTCELGLVGATHAQNLGQVAAVKLYDMAHSWILVPSWSPGPAPAHWAPTLSVHRETHGPSGLEVGKHR